MKIGVHLVNFGLAGHCTREGTDYDRIRKTILWTGPIGPSSAEGKAFAAQMRHYRDVGIDEVHIMPFTDDPVAFVHGVGDHIVGPLHAL
jgi:hypothetical protein